MIKVLLFARLREQLEVGSLSFDWGDDATVDVLANQLVQQQGANWQVLLADEIVVAINQQVVGRDALVSAGDEVAFFPPVTGG
ncbi:molybdopterin converting factor subunit 1 [Pseudomonadales bacterium]|nr:molybdopterin converting factor subunit 1 [Pseudomonadales bacterium]